ncbi:unnamed protein product [Clavelina lepadiformis]|uniref:G-protein coupled receptors family 1 profile domain-containing protein n=1 Tax=Clavelina lepadiformis TaxID=159417 RepID=A0ABP0GD69_CLALP
MDFDFQTNNLSYRISNRSELCKPVPMYSTLAFLIVPIVQVAINVIVIYAAIKNRRKLRHNYVYIYVISTLSANALFGILACYQLTNQVIHFERLWSEANPFSLDNSSFAANVLKGWWVFRTGYMITLFIIMSASISALIFGIRESSYFVGRAACHVPERKSFGKASPKRRKTVIGIVVSIWVLPTILNIVASISWSCVDLCFCTPGYYGQDLFYCQSDVNRHCSRFLQPQRNDFLIVALVIWCCETMSMIIMMVTTVRKYVQIMGTTATPSYSLESVLSATTTAPAQQDNFTPTRMPSIALNIANNRIQEEAENAIDEEQNTAVEKKLGCGYFSHFNYNVKLLVIISCLFMVCTFPMMIIMIVDVASTDYVLNYYVVLLGFVLTLIYSTVSPLILVYYMPGLRLVLKRTFFNCCSVTTITHGSPKSSLS